MDQSCLCYDNPASWPARGKHPANPKKIIFIWSPSFHMAMFITYSLKARGSLKQKLHSRFKFQLDHPE